MKKILIWIIVILGSLLILIYAFNIDYLLKGVRTIYLTGNNTAFISDYEYFENREIKSSVSQPWLLHEKYNSVTQSENLKKLNEERKLIPLDNLNMKVMSFGFISGNQSPTIWRGPLVARMTEQFFYDVIWGELDYLILDLPPGTGDIQLTLTQKLKMDGALIITTPQDIALADVKKGADMFRKVKTPVLGVIENMSGLFLDGKVETGSNLSIEGQPVTIKDDGSFTIRMDLFKKGGGKTESDRLGVPLLGQIPISQDIMETTDSGSPIVNSHPDSHIGVIYKDIAKKIIDLLNV